MTFEAEASPAQRRDRAAAASTAQRGDRQPRPAQRSGVEIGAEIGVEIGVEIVSPPPDGEGGRPARPARTIAAGRAKARFGGEDSLLQLDLSLQRSAPAPGGVEEAGASHASPAEFGGAGASLRFELGVGLVLYAFEVL